MKQKGSSDVKGSLLNHLDKKVLLWHREAPLFLRVYLAVNGTVTNLPVFFQNTLNCLPKMNEAFTGLERHGGK